MRARAASIPIPISQSLSVSRAVQHLKSRSLHKLLSEFGILRKRYWARIHRLENRQLAKELARRISE
jgi:hypothetical protein